MWTLIALLLVVAVLEHAHWYFITRPTDEAMHEGKTMDVLREEALARGLEAMTEMSETLYLLTSDLGTKYSPVARKMIAHNVMVARLTLVHTEAAPSVQFETAEGFYWPFDKDGKVKFDAP